MKIEEFRIVEKLNGFQIQRLTTYKEWVYPWLFFGKTVEKKEYCPIDFNGNGMVGKIGWYEKDFKQGLLKTKETAVNQIHWIIKQYNRKHNHVDKIYYPPFDEENVTLKGTEIDLKK